ncbi:MAG: MarR family winged helix-turn-helix transcriptional regulator [Acidimicrobiales bacterium]|jgi:DNA-binding MarR family transcriptional regulator
MTEPRWLSENEQGAWRGYRRMRALLDLQIARDLARDSDLSGPDYDVLSTLSEIPERSWRATELAARLLWSTSRLAHHIGRMERRGLVSRGNCADDGRGAMISLTGAGWAALQAAAPPHVESVRRHLIDLLTTAEVQALADISAKVIAHIDHLGQPD